MKFHMDTLENAKLTASVRLIARFFKSGIPIYNSKVPDTAGRKNKKMKTGNCKALCVLRKRNNGNTSKVCEICLELTINTPER